MRRIIILIGAFLIGLSAPAIAEDEAWHGGASKDGTRASLYYGAKANPEILSVSLDCATFTGVVTVFLPESDEAFKPGYPACMTLSAGKASSKVCGGTSPNELAGIPSLEGMTGVNDPVLQAMRKASALTIQVGGGKPYKISLKGAGAKVDAFLKACAPS